ncbi:MAG: hypothetical protein ACRC6A_05665 [Fusobacteriaceae bacterium]
MDEFEDIAIDEALEPTNEQEDLETSNDDLEVDVDAEFDPDEEDFDDERYTIHGYNLESLNDILFLDDPENVEVATAWLAKYVDAGFSQEQMEFLIRKEMAEEEKPTKKGKTASEIKDDLKTNLTSEERRNYKAVNSFLADTLEGTELEGYRKEIMQNPYLVKFANAIYTKSLGQTGRLNKTMPRATEKTISATSYEDAKSQLMDALQKKQDVKAVASKLAKSVSDKDSFSQLIQAMGL